MGLEFGREINIWDQFITYAVYCQHVKHSFRLFYGPTRRFWAAPGRCVTIIVRARLCTVSRAAGVRLHFFCGSVTLNPYPHTHTMCWLELERICGCCWDSQGVKAQRLYAGAKTCEHKSLIIARETIFLWRLAHTAALGICETIAVCYNEKWNLIEKCYRL